MELLKRYSISFTIACIVLYFFTIWVEKQHESNMPHNLSTKNEEIVEITIPVQHYFEKCLDLKESQELQYGFESQAPLSFNLHYHQLGETFYALEEESVVELEKTFQAEERGYYCLKWGNSGQDKVEMNYYFKILD